MDWNNFCSGWQECLWAVILAEDKTKMKSNTAPYTVIKNLVIKPDGGGSYL